MSGFYNSIKLNAGIKALDTLQGELAGLGCYRPLLLVSPAAEQAGFVKLIRKTSDYSELPVVRYKDGEEDMDLEGLFQREGCDGIVAAGGSGVFSAAGEFGRSPFAAVPCGEYDGQGLVPVKPGSLQPDLAIIEPRLSRNSRAEIKSNPPSVCTSTHNRVWTAAAASLFAGAGQVKRKNRRRYIQALAAVTAEIASSGSAEDATPAISGEKTTTAHDIRSARLPDYFEFTGRGRIVSGQGALEKLPSALIALGGTRPMLLSDAGVARAGLTRMVETIIAGQTPAVVIDTSIPSDSDVTVVRNLAGLYKEHNCNALVAVGGGSVLDTAKGVNILVGTGALQLSEYAGAGKIRQPLPPLAAIPTTSGTGSETTLVAVIADHAASLKLLYTSPFLQPDIAVLDPRMTASLPPALTAATGMDALTHAMEAYYCLGHNPVSDQHALEAVRLIGKYLLGVVREPDHAEGRNAMAVASNLAGLAFSNSMVGMVHTLGHSVGAVCGVHHGVCMSVLLPYGIEYNLKRIGGELMPLLEALTGKTTAQAGPALAAEVRRLNEELHMLTNGKHPRNLSEALGRDNQPLVRKEDLPVIARTAMGDGSLLYNPEEMDYNEALIVLQAAFIGDPLL